MMARVKLLGATGQLLDAHATLRRAQVDYPPATIPVSQFRQLILASVLVHETVLAKSWLLERFRASYGLEIGIEVSDAHPSAVNLRIKGDEARFLFTRSLYEWPACELIISRWTAIYPLFDAFMRSPHRLDGSVDINFADIGHRPGLAFSEHTPGYYLIPDPSYLETERYAELSRLFRVNNVPWNDRVPVAFWRGATTGVGRRHVPIGHYPDPATRWRGAPRIRLCEIARDNPDIIDAGITSIIQIVDPGAADWLQSRDLLRQHVPPQSFQQYRYQIDIDGNSNSWPGLFTKLLTGGPVLKVASRRGFQQWYYDRLTPWINYIPVAADMNDLVDKVLWLRANDNVARRIGAAGRDLAETLTGEQEIVRSAPVFAAAMRAARGDNLIEFDFGMNSVDGGVLESGWHEPDGDGARAKAVLANIELPKPPGLGRYVLNCDVSPGPVTPRRLIITANGEPVVTTTITERTRISCPLSREIATARQRLNLGFWSPDAETIASQPQPLDFRMVLHGLGIAAAPHDAGPGVRNQM
jgi:hypothetical protein